MFRYYFFIRTKYKDNSLLAPHQTQILSQQPTQGILTLTQVTHHQTLIPDTVMHGNTLHEHTFYFIFTGNRGKEIELNTKSKFEIYFYTTAI